MITRINTLRNSNTCLSRRGDSYEGEEYKLSDVARRQLEVMNVVEKKTKKVNKLQQQEHSMSCATCKKEGEDCRMYNAHNTAEWKYNRSSNNKKKVALACMKAPLSLVVEDELSAEECLYNAQQKQEKGGCIVTNESVTMMVRWVSLFIANSR